jgi:hypothetical protein
MIAFESYGIGRWSAKGAGIPTLDHEQIFKVPSLSTMDQHQDLGLRRNYKSVQPPSNSSEVLLENSN